MTSWHALSVLCFASACGISGGPGNGDAAHAETGAVTDAMSHDAPTRDGGTTGSDAVASQDGTTGLDAGSHDAIGASPIADASELSIDCLGSDGSCPAMNLGEAPAPGLFHGFADMSIRRDPSTSWLWLSYSYLIVNQGAPATPALDIHVTHSEDDGVTWATPVSIFSSAQVTDPNLGGGTTGVFWSSHEVSNLLPWVNSDGSVSWVLVHHYYTVQAGKPLYSPLSQFAGSSVLVIAETTGDPTTLGTAPSQSLGATGTTIPNYSLSALDAQLSDCSILAEPALVQIGSKLFLAAQCIYSTGTTMDNSLDYYAVFETTPAGPPSTWTWTFNGKLFQPGDAVKLSPTAQYVVELDIAKGSDGGLLGILTPTYDNPALKTPDVHEGCRVVQIASLSNPAIASSPTGNYVELAQVNATDLYDAGNAGPGSCTYEPSSALGLLISRRLAADPVLGFDEIPQRTGLRP